jgi:hypothetical protein
MPTTRNRLTLSPAGLDFLLGELRAIAGGSGHAHRRRSRLLAVTFRPRKRGRDAIPDRPIPLDDFRMLALSYTRDYRGRRGTRRRVELGIYRATLDLPGSGRVVFRLERSFEVTAPRALIRPRVNVTAIRTAVVLHQAVEDADRDEVAPRLALPRFEYGFDPGRTPEFVPSRAGAAPGDGREIDGLRAWPAELFVGDDGRSSLTRPPARVFASLAALKGRRVRNPSFAVLRRRGILPAGPGYRAWLATVRRPDGTLQDPHLAGTEAARVRLAIQDHLLADPAREPAILAELASACAAMGVRVPDGPEGVDALAELLDNAWHRPEVGYAAGIQVVGLAGPPGPSTMGFSDGAASVDLPGPGPGRGRDPSPPGLRGRAAGR